MKRLILNQTQENFLEYFPNLESPIWFYPLDKKRHPGIVQTPQQYNFIYTALLDEICYPTTVSKSLKKVIQWHSVKIYDKEFLSKSGPYLKRKFYLQFLSDNTSNDLKYILRDKDNGESSPEDRSFLVSSTPLLRFVDNFNILVH